MNDCRVQLAKQPQEQAKDQGTGGRSSWPKRDLKDIECFNCHKKGHYSSNCPQNAMLCTERSVVSGVISGLKKQQFVAQSQILRSGVVEGRRVSDILLDTGCSRTLINQELVPESKLKDGGAVAIRCAHGDTVLYPLADVTLEVEGRQIVVEAAVSDTLPMSVLLGTDNTELAELLADGEDKEAEDAMHSLSLPEHRRREKRTVDQ